MEQHRNHLGQPIGAPVPSWSPRPRPPRTAMAGRFCTVEPLDPERHAAQLFAAYAEDAEGRIWTYLPRGPYATLGEYRSWAESACRGDDPLVHAILDKSSDAAVGTAAYMRIEPAIGVIEIGSITYSPRLQRRPAATEAMYLMMRRVFDELGYRRYEWKCDSLNQPSREAAARLGFRYEGLFRQASITRARNRDTTWFSVIDSEWPALRAAFERWLDPANFAPDGTQRRSLASFRSSAG
jgi:RimJ/RimL family protein N-acetyltransferase